VNGQQPGHGQLAYRDKGRFDAALDCFEQWLLPSAR
jgi:hypothetical protein